MKNLGFSNQLCTRLVFSIEVHISLCGEFQSNLPSHRPMQLLIPCSPSKKSSTHIISIGHLLHLATGASILQYSSFAQLLLDAQPQNCIETTKPLRL
eukprot:UN18068